MNSNKPHLRNLFYDKGLTTEEQADLAWTGLAVYRAVTGRRVSLAQNISGTSKQRAYVLSLLNPFLNRPLGPQRQAFRDFFDSHAPEVQHGISVIGDKWARRARDRHTDNIARAACHDAIRGCIIDLGLLPIVSTVVRVVTCAHPERARYAEALQELSALHPRDCVDIASYAAFMARSTDTGVVYPFGADDPLHQHPEMSDYRRVSTMAQRMLDKVPSLVPDGEDREAYEGLFPQATLAVCAAYALQLRDEQDLSYLTEFDRFV